MVYVQFFYNFYSSNSASCTRVQVWCVKSLAPILYHHHMCVLFTMWSCRPALWPWAQPRDLLQTMGWYQAQHRQGICRVSLHVVMPSCISAIATKRASSRKLPPLPPSSWVSKLTQMESTWARSSAYTDAQLGVDSLNPAPPSYPGLQPPRHEAQPPRSLQILKITWLLLYATESRSGLLQSITVKIANPYKGLLGDG